MMMMDCAALVTRLLVPAQSLRARGLERLQRDEVTAVAVHFHSLDADGNLAAAASAA
ncbi:hypothetical protein ACVW1A_004173 [Bradyrhizobium sp. LB1.3]